MRFNSADLRIFLHVFEAGSMTGAAARCHLTVAAVSARIRNLEEGSGMVLLSRQPRGVVATPAGEVLAAHARLVFGQLQQLQRDLLHVREDGPRPTVLLANSSALARPLAEALAEPDGPGTCRPLLVRESSSEATVEALRMGTADVGIVSDAVDTRGLVAQELGRDPLVLVVPRAHALAVLPAVRFAQALAQPWVAWGEHSALSTHLQMRAMALGTRIAARFSYPGLSGVLNLIGRGRGVTVLPRAVLDAHADTGEVACVALDEPWAHRHLLVCYAEGEDPVRAGVAHAIARRWCAWQRAC